MITSGTSVISSVLVASVPRYGSLVTSESSCANWISTNYVPELSSPLCANTRQSCFGLIARGENSTTKSARTCPLITALSKNFLSDWPSSIAHLKSRPDKSAFDKIFFNENSMYTAMGCTSK